jgi:hypothetical protein
MALQAYQYKKFMTINQDGADLVTRLLTKDEIKWIEDELARLEKEHQGDSG